MIDHGLAPYFGLKQATPSISQMLVMDWDSGDSLPAFQGVALDTEKGKFVLTLLDADSGERSVNYLQAREYKAAQIEADYLRFRLEAIGKYLIAPCGNLAAEAT
jgi:hypothetical protein